MRQIMRVVVTLLLLSVTFSQLSVARAQTLPEVNPVNKVRVDYAISFSGEVVAYGTGRIESPTRFYSVNKSQFFEETDTTETVLYDGLLYTRSNDETTWTVEEQGQPDVEVPTGELLSPDLLEFPITLIGTEQVDGVATDHYQIWINDDSGSYSKVDMWIGQQTRYVHKLSVSFYESAESTVAEIGLTYRYYDFNNPDILVSPPPAELVEAASAGNGASWLEKQIGAYLRQGAVFTR